MSHICQLQLIKSLIDAGGSATVRQLARQFLLKDESQVLHYVQRIKALPLPILKKHGIVQREKDLISLTKKGLTFTEKAELAILCEKKLQQLVARRGMGLWDYHPLDSDTVPDSLRYIALRESGGRCALCGATKKDQRLNVDHIVPRSKGGKTEYENLRVLCVNCYRVKGNKDQTDFRHDPSYSVEDCRFCYDNITNIIVEEFDTVSAITDGYPVTSGHLLIVPKRHITDYLLLSQREKNDADNLIRLLADSIKQKDSRVTGFNIGANCGESAGQTIFHAHIHLIPRRDGDTPNPRGGVRGVIPGKRAY